MKIISKLLLLSLCLIMTVIFTGCATTSTTGEKGQDIISAEDALELMESQELVLVDSQKASEYKKGHLMGAVNISRGDIVVFGVVPNLLAPKEKIEEVMGSNGIANDTLLLIYDNNNNMDSARLWWTLKTYGHEQMKVVSGGLNALVKAGAETVTELPEITAVEYIAKEKNTELIASREEVKAQVDDPADDVVLLDTRTQGEYNNGTIPGSILVDYQSNNYQDGTYRPVQNIQIIYMEAGIKPDDTVIMYCKTSIRAAQTFLALHNAGYRNLKIYDGAWIEWSSDTSLPVQMPDNNQVEANFQDNS